MATRLTPESANRVFLRAQGFADGRPAGPVDIRHVRRALSKVSLLQLDSVNVVTRAHYMPLFARLGDYDPAVLDRLVAPNHEVFEFWAHALSYIPVEMYPLFEHARRRNAERHGWKQVKELNEREPGYIEAVYDEIAQRGPLPTRELSDPGERTGPWWGYGKGKLALEWLFDAGRITVAHRENFQRFYDLPERVIPAEILAAPVPSVEDSIRDRVLVAIRSLGVGTVKDIADYFRLTQRVVGPQIERLVAAGKVLPVAVDGWGATYMAADAVVPRKPIEGRALMAPFDSLVWDRDRTERMFGFHYRIEIYVPKPKRVHGYYVLPFLLDESLVARVDAKADRSAGVLRVPAAFAEDGVDRARVAAELADELRLMAAWLGLDDVEVGERGDLSAALTQHL